MIHLSLCPWFVSVGRCLALASLLVAPTPDAGAACPDADNNVPGCRFDSNDDYLAFLLQATNGSPWFEAVAGHVAPGALAVTETTANRVGVQSVCFPTSFLPDYLYGAHLQLVPPATAGTCSLTLISYDDLNCEFILEAPSFPANLAPGWNRLEARRGLSIAQSVKMTITCESMSDGGVLLVDDVFGGRSLFYDSFESATTGAWSFVSGE